MSDDTRDRLTRLETTQEHVDKTLTKLVMVSENMSEAIIKLTEQQNEQQRMAKQLVNLDRAREQHSERLIHIEDALVPLVNLPNDVSQNKFILKIIVWVSAAVTTGAIATIWGLVSGFIKT